MSIPKLGVSLRNALRWGGMRIQETITNLSGSELMRVEERRVLTVESFDFQCHEGADCKLWNGVVSFVRTGDTQQQERSKQ
jgi:hypothetical protein